MTQMPGLGLSFKMPVNEENAVGQFNYVLSLQRGECVVQNLSETSRSSSTLNATSSRKVIVASDTVTTQTLTHCTGKL